MWPWNLRFLFSVAFVICLCGFLQIILTTVYTKAITFSQLLELEPSRTNAEDLASVSGTIIRGCQKTLILGRGRFYLEFWVLFEVRG